MGVERRGPGERAIALRARVNFRLRMRAHVRFQVIGTRKRFRALRARVRTFAGVSAHVHFEKKRFFERLTAHAARTSAGVSFRDDGGNDFACRRDVAVDFRLMRLQACPIGKRFAAESAFERFCCLSRCQRRSLWSTSYGATEKSTKPFLSASFARDYVEFLTFRQALLNLKPQQSIIDKKMTGNV